MDELSGSKERLSKRPYVRPHVQAVELKPEEAVLGNCKTVHHAGPAGPHSCTTPVACCKKGS